MIRGWWVGKVVDKTKSDLRRNICYSNKSSQEESPSPNKLHFVFVFYKTEEFY